VAPGWEERWREFHRPVRVGPLWIGPPWEQPPADAVPVIIEPGRAFGTGSHPTTRLCLAFLQELERGSLLDVGCGSGVLAVAGAKLGFQPVVAVDHDPAALEATRKNAHANAVVVATRYTDALAGDLPATDVAVANVDLAAVEALGSSLDAALLATSGYVDSHMPTIGGFGHRDRRVDGEWAADLFERQ
jgi:ribosomal protein L11 methyltransferase